VSARHFLDTNILLYSISSAAEEAAKRERAIELLDDDRGGLSVQVLQEFFVQATRATRADRLTQDVATALIHTWLRFSVQDITVPVLLDALEIKSKHGFSYWESAIVASARALGCKQLYSEDMDHGRDVGGVVIINPFR